MPPDGGRTVEGEALADKRPALAQGVCSASHLEVAHVDNQEQLQVEVEIAPLPTIDRLEANGLQV
eukprot:12998778-Alexandrium_andersonii.AAC.1